MRALSLALLLVAAAPAFADTPPPPEAAPPAEAQPAEAPPAEAPPEAQPAEEPAPAPAPARRRIIPPALTPPVIAPAVEAPPEPPPRRYAYRWQVATADITAIVMSLAVDRISADGGDRPGALATLTIATYFFAAPMVHGVHRQGKRALGSFALRAGLPLLLGLLGEQIDGTPECDACQDTLRSEGKLIGLTAGVLIAMAVDNALLARPIWKRGERPRAAWTPALAGVRGGALAGLSGSF